MGRYAIHYSFDEEINIANTTVEEVKTECEELAQEIVDQHALDNFKVTVMEIED